MLVCQPWRDVLDGRHHDKNTSVQQLWSIMSSQLQTCSVCVASYHRAQVRQLVPCKQVGARWWLDR